MICRTCGKEISNQAKFCNFCGASTAPQPSQPSQQPASQKSGVGRTILTVIIAAVILLGGKYILSAIKVDPTDTCYLGALYQDGYVTYGSARLNMPGYTMYYDHIIDDDVLVSSDGNAYFSVDLDFNLSGDKVSYTKSDEDGILLSYSIHSYDTDVSMVDFRKYKEDGFRVIRYIVSYVENGVDCYAAELIVFPSEQASSTMRLMMNAYGAEGFSEINRVFDTLSISSDYNLVSGSTDGTGTNQITVR